MISAINSRFGFPPAGRNAVSLWKRIGDCPGRIARWLRKHWIVAAILLALIIVVLVVFLQPLPVLRLFARNSDVLYFSNPRERVVALTIDAAPHPLVTFRILDVLKINGAHATFFVIGDHTPGNLEILERARRKGHELEG